MMSNTRKLAWLAWFVASLFYAYQYILRVMPNVMLTDLMQRFQIDAAAFGQFSGGFYIGYCLLHLPVGIMLDRFGPRKIMTLCVMLTAIGVLPILFSEHFIYPVLGRVLIGIGSSGAILGTFKIIRMTFQENQFPRMLSFSVTIGLIGAIYGGVPLSYFCKTFGYQPIIESLAVMGLILAFITYLAVPEDKEKQHTSLGDDIKLVLGNRTIMMICIFSGFLVGPMEGFADAWGSEYLKQVYRFEPKTANFLTSMIYIGMCFAPILSRIGEKTGNYLGTITGAAFIMFTVYALLILGLLSTQTISIGFFIVGICCAYQVLAIYQVTTYVPPNIVGLTSAVANMVIMGFGYLFHTTIGLIVKFMTQYGHADAYSVAIGIIPVTLLIGSIGFLTVTCRSKTRMIH